MRLASLKEFRSLVYSPDSAPTIDTLRARLDKIPGGRRDGKRCYVDLDEYDRATNLSAQVMAKRDRLAKNPALKGLL